jgi:hypothetical protein
MRSIDASTALKNRMAELEIELKADEHALKIHVKELAHNLKPGNLIKHSLKEIVTSPELKNNLLNTAIGMATGFIARKMLVGGSKNPITKMVGKLTEISVANKVGNNADGIRSLGEKLIKKLFHKKEHT